MSHWCFILYDGVYIQRPTRYNWYCIILTKLHSTELRISLSHFPVQLCFCRTSHSHLTPRFFALFTVGILLPHEDPRRDCVVCLTVLCHSPASSSSPFVAIETASHGKVQASRSSGERTVSGSDSWPVHTTRQRPKQQQQKRNGFEDGLCYPTEQSKWCSTVLRSGLWDGVRSSYFWWF